MLPGTVGLPRSQSGPVQLVEVDVVVDVDMDVDVDVVASEELRPAPPEDDEAVVVVDAEVGDRPVPPEVEGFEVVGVLDGEAVVVAPDVAVGVGVEVGPEAVLDVELEEPALGAGALEPELVEPTEPEPPHADRPERVTASMAKIDQLRPRTIEANVSGRVTAGPRALRARV